MEVRLNGATMAMVDLPADGEWLEVAVPLAGIARDARFVCELRLLHGDPAQAQFEDYVFAVRGREFA